MSMKRKRVVLTLEEKLEVVKLREEGVPIERIAAQFNIGGSTVSEIFKRRSDIEVAVENNRKTGKVRKTLKESTRPEIEHVLYDWFLEQRDVGLKPGLLDIMDKAKVIHSEMSQETENEHHEWNPTKGWAIRFKERYGIKSEPKSPTETKLTNSQSALEAAEFLLDYINNRDYLLKDVITVRMIRDRIASEQDYQSSE